MWVKNLQLRDTREFLAPREETNFMTYFSNPEETGKICSVCESKSYRAFAEEIGSGTIFAIEPWELVDSSTGETHPADEAIRPLGLTAYICSDKKCGHVDFYVYSIDQPESRQ